MGLARNDKRNLRVTTDHFIATAERITPAHSGRWWARFGSWMAIAAGVNNQMRSPPTAAAEWLLDNFHLVTSEIREIHQHLPGSYYRQLPSLASRAHAGHTRIYAMAVELASQRQPPRSPPAGDVRGQLPARGGLDDRRAVGVAQHAQLALIENLRRLAAETLQARDARLAGDAYAAQLEREARSGRSRL